jgi:hypothetical protein
VVITINGRSWAMSPTFELPTGFEPANLLLGKQTLYHLSYDSTAIR